MQQTIQPAERIAVVLFTGDSRREARQKGLPPHLLPNLHRQLVRTVGLSHNMDLFRVFRKDGITYLDTRGKRAEISRSQSLVADVEMAIAESSARGYQKVILLAGDVCTLDERILRDAAAQLRREGPVAIVGHSGDGGFYLAGFNRFPDLDWFRILAVPASSAAALRKEATAAGFLVSETTVVPDIDELEDAIRLSHWRAGGMLSRAQVIIRSIIKGASLRSFVLPVFAERDFDLRRFQLPPPGATAC